jgi:hypothetical protein
VRTITVLLHGRPQLLGPQLDALVRCQEICAFDKLVLSVDSGHPNTDLIKFVAPDAAGAIAQAGLIDCEVVCSRKNLGVATHPKTAMARAFSSGATLAVSLEDDALPKPDLLRMALYYEQIACQDLALISFCNHRDFGRGQQDKIPEDDPSFLAESPHISSPFAWATVPEHWHWMEKYWNFKRVAPLGWDFSLSMAMRLGKKVGIHPILSRCQNVGREGGTHESPESFDRTQLGLRYQEAPYLGKYNLVATLDRGELDKVDDWMQPELWRMGREPAENFCKECFRLREECACQSQP